MKLYLAGPMTGYPEHNFPLFHSEAKRLRELGYEVVNPAEMNAGFTTQWAKCMAEDIKAAVDCDAIALLPNWFRSKGATLEHLIMKELGKAIYVASDLIVSLNPSTGLVAPQGKPFKGTIDLWFIAPFGSDLKNCVFGVLRENGLDIRTSFIVDQTEDYVETNNSKYKLGTEYKAT